MLSVAPPGRGGDVCKALERVFAALDCDVTFHAVPLSQTDLLGGEVPDDTLAAELLRPVRALAERARSDGTEPALSAGSDT